MYANGINVLTLCLTVIKQLYFIRMNNITKQLKYHKDTTTIALQIHKNVFYNSVLSQSPEFPTPFCNVPDHQRHGQANITTRKNTTITYYAFL